MKSIFRKLTNRSREKYCKSITFGDLLLFYHENRHDLRA